MILSFKASRKLKEFGYNEPCSHHYQYALNESLDPETGKSEGSFGWEKGELTRHSDFFINNDKSIDHSNKSWYLCSAPRLYDVQDWLIKRAIHFYVVPIDENNDGNIKYVWCVFKQETSTKSYKTREEAVEKGMKEIFKYLKNG